MNLRRALGLLAVLLLLAPHASASVDAPPPEWLVDEVRTLSAPDMEGRRAGTPGAERAARHIAEVFRDAGLRPGGDAGGYLQRFGVATGITLGAGNALTVLGPAARTLALGQEFTPLAVSADGDVDADVVFVGYGITAPDLSYDDYAGVDARGRIVLAMTGEPRADDPASPFRRPEAYHYSERSHKIINAREHGARGILLVARPGARDALPRLGGVSQPWGIVAAQVTRPVGEAVLAGAGLALGGAAEAIDRALAPRSAPLANTRVRLTVSLVRERRETANVVGILPGSDPRLRDEAIVVGAHYDHLGRGGEGSLAPDEVGAIHPGADDNASGASAVMGLARAFVAAGGAPRTLVFVAFAGEELGLLGSSYYVKHPSFPLDRTVLMVNLDMVGRLRKDKLYVGGADSGVGLRRVLEETGRGLGLALQLRGDPFAPSDHTVFYSAGRPVIFLFTGAHNDYHRPSDTWDKVNGRGLQTVVAFAARVIEAVAGAATPPTYVKIDRPARGAGRGGYGPFFGVVPEFGDAELAGVKIGGVRPGSPADRAGVRAGDVIVKFAGVAVSTLEDLTFALRSHRPGDRVDVIVVRDGRERRVQAVLDERR